MWCDKGGNAGTNNVCFGQCPGWWNQPHDCPDGYIATSAVGETGFGPGDQRAPTFPLPTPRMSPQQRATSDMQ